VLAATVPSATRESTHCTLPQGRVMPVAEEPPLPMTFLRGAMRTSRVAVVAVAIALAAGMSIVPLHVAGAQSPSTSVLIPSSGATLSGSTYLDASASNATSVEFLLFGGSFGFNAPTICTATATIYGWLCGWNTTTVPNGSYFLVSEVSGEGGSAFSSAGVSVSVNNPPPSTTVLIPASGATLDSAQDTVLDAVASPGVTKVTIEINVFGSLFSYATTPTIYGWIAAIPGTPCNPIHCMATGLPATVQSVASYSGGVSGTSPAVNVTITVYGGVN